MAGQVAAYTFGPTGSPTTSATTVDSNITASAFSSFTGSGAAINNSPGSSTAGGSGGYYFSANTFRTSDGNYFAFTITPAEGYQVTLSSVSFYYLSTASGPTDSALQSSNDSYGSNLAAFSLTHAGSTPAASDWHLASSSITLTFTSATTFHLTGAGASGSTGAFRVDDVTFSGTVSAIPEPSTYAAIIGSVALAGATWHRRKKSPSA